MTSSVPRKFWIFCIIGIIVQCIVVLAVSVRVFAPTNNIANWLLYAIYNSRMAPLTTGTFNFILDWAEVISVAAFIVIIPAVIAIIKSNRRKALVRLHTWSTDAVSKLTATSQLVFAEKELDHLEERLYDIIVNNSSALADTRAIGNGLTPKVEKAVENLLKLEDCFNNHTDLADLKVLLQTTVTCFKDVSTLTYNSLHQSL